MTTLLDQCHEVLHDILSNVNPDDLGRLSCTCTTLRNYITGNWLLWKRVYLDHYDALELEDPIPESRWEEDLKRFTNASKILKSKTKQVKQQNLEQVATTLTSILESSSPNSNTSRNVQKLVKELNLDNIATFVLNSNLFEVARKSEPSKTSRLSNLLARVHCVFGASHDYIPRSDEPPHLRSPKTCRVTQLEAHPYARARVYDMRSCSHATKWGPWAQDGSLDVDWELVECIMINMAYNLERFCEEARISMDVPWRRPFRGAQQNSYVDSFPRTVGETSEEEEEDEGPSLPYLSYGAHRLYSRREEPIEPPQPSRDALDPYGITGTWQRMFSFLDYTDFHYINHEPGVASSQPLRPVWSEEATRLMLLRLHVTKIEPLPNSPLPVVHFKGVSRSMHPGWDLNSSSRIQGTVSLTPEGHVRWSTLSLFNGEARWRTEAVQIGGPRSGRGFIGRWFEKDMSEGGPMGPTAMWKLTDRIKCNNLRWRRGSQGVRLALDGQEVDIPDAYAAPEGILDDEDSAEDEDWVPLDDDALDEDDWLEGEEEEEDVIPMDMIEEILNAEGFH